MERLRNMGLKRSFVILAALCLLAALALTAAVYIACGWIAHPEKPLCPGGPRGPAGAV